MEDKLKTLKDVSTKTFIDNKRVISKDGFWIDEVWDRTISENELRDEGVRWVKAIKRIKTEEEAIDFWVDEISFGTHNKGTRTSAKKLCISHSPTPKFYLKLLEGISVFIHTICNITDEKLK